MARERSQGQHATGIPAVGGPSPAARTSSTEGSAAGTPGVGHHLWHRGEWERLPPGGGAAHAGGACRWAWDVLHPREQRRGAPPRIGGLPHAAGASDAERGRLGPNAGHGAWAHFPALPDPPSSGDSHRRRVDARSANSRTDRRVPGDRGGADRSSSGGVQGFRAGLACTACPRPRLPTSATSTSRSRRPSSCRLDGGDGGYGRPTVSSGSRWSRQCEP